MEVATATEASAPTASGGASRRSHPFPWLDAAISEPFYFLHLLAFFSYFAARSAVSSAYDGGELHSCLLRREIQAVLVFLVLFAVKIVKEENWETFIADSLLYAKVTRNYRAQQMSQYVPSMPVTNSMSTSAAQVGTLSDPDFTIRNLL